MATPLQHSEDTMKQKMRCYIRDIRTRLRLTCSPYKVPQEKCRQDHDVIFLNTLYVRDANELVSFIDVSKLLEVVLSTGKTHINSVSDLFGMEKFSIGGFTTSIKYQPQIKTWVAQKTGPFLFKSEQHESMPYHDYDNEALYSWKGKLSDVHGYIPGYEMDYLVYQFLLYPVTYNTFIEGMIERLSSIAGYTIEEKDAFRQELLDLHKQLVCQKHINH